MRLVVAAAAAVLTGSCSRAPEAPFPRAPIVIVSLDTVRADSVSGFGGPEGATPTIESLLPTSIRFVEAVASSHHTAPSHATLLTGFSPFVHGVALAEGDSVFRIPSALPTLAERLREKGYRTGAFTDGVQVTAARGFDRGFDVFVAEYSHLDAKLDRIERFLDEAGQEPFLLFVHTYRAHQPYRAPPEVLDRLLADYDGVFKEPALAAARLDPLALARGDPEAAAAQNRAILQLSARRWKKRKDLRFLRALYDAAVGEADREMGRLFERLRRRGLFDRAIVVVTSDHGEAFLEHRPCVNHMDLWDEVLRVPLLVRLPGGQGGGRTVETQVGHTAIVPTLLDLVAGERVECEGTSLAPALLGGDVEERSVASAMFVSGRAEPVLVTLRRSFGKYFECLADAQDLPPRSRALCPRAYFDLERDPGERQNLAAREPEGMRRLVEELERRRRTWRSWRERLGVRGERFEMDEEARRALHGLGYLGGK